MNRILECLGKIGGQIDGRFIDEMRNTVAIAPDDPAMELSAVDDALASHTARHEALVKSILEQHPTGPAPAAPVLTPPVAPAVASAPAPVTAAAPEVTAPTVLELADNVMKLTSRFKKAANSAPGVVTSIPELLSGLTPLTPEKVLALEQAVTKFESDAANERVVRARAQVATSTERAALKQKTSDLAAQQAGDRAEQRMRNLIAREKLKLPPTDSEITPAADPTAAIAFAQKINRAHGLTVLQEMLAGKIPEHVESGDVPANQAHAIFTSAKGLIADPAFRAQLEKHIDDLMIAQKTAAAEPAPAPLAPVEAPKGGHTPPASFDKPVSVVDLRNSTATRLVDEKGNLVPDAAARIKGADFQKGLGELLGTTLSDEGNRALTREAMVWRAPDGSFVMSGIEDRTNYNKGILSVAGKLEKGHTAQNMGTGRKTKVITADGDAPALIKDVVDAGFVPVMKVRFEGDPSKIHHRFNTLADVEAALNKTPRHEVAISDKSAGKAAKDAADLEALAGSPELQAELARKIAKAESDRQNFRQTGREATGDEAVAAAESQAAGPQRARTTVDEGGNSVGTERGAAPVREPFVYGDGPWKLAVVEPGKPARIIETIKRASKESDKNLKDRIAAAHNRVATAHDGVEVQVIDSAGKVQNRISVTRTDTAKTPGYRVTDADRAEAISLMRGENGDGYIEQFVMKHYGQGDKAITKAIVAEQGTNSPIAGYIDSVGSGKKAYAVITDLIKNGPEHLRKISRASRSDVPTDTSGEGRARVVSPGTARTGGDNDPLSGSAERGQPPGAKPQRGGEASGADSGHAIVEESPARVAGKADAAGVPKPEQLEIQKAFRLRGDDENDTGITGMLLDQLATAKGEPDKIKTGAGAGEYTLLAQQIMKDSGADWEQVRAFIKAAYKMSDGAENREQAFHDLLTKGASSELKQRLIDTNRNESLSRAAAAPTPAEQVRLNDTFRTLLDRQVRSGADVTILKGELANAAVNTRTRQFVYVLEDVSNASFQNIVSVFHESGHDLLASYAPEQRGRILQAATNAVHEINDPRMAKNANASAEERLVESLALKLADEGFGTKAPTLAQAFMRTVKDLYLRVARATLKAMGGEPSDKMMLDWFENSLRRQTGGDYDVRSARLLDAFRPRTRNEVYDRVDDFRSNATAPLPDFLDPVTKQFRQPEMTPLSSEAVEWHLREAADDKEGDMPGREARAREAAAGWNLVGPIIEEVRAKVAAQLTPEQFWRMFARGDTPTEILQGIDRAVPGAAAATLRDANFTDAMKQKANAHAYALAHSLAARTRRKLALLDAVAKKAANEIGDKAIRLNKVSVLFKDAEASEAFIKDAVNSLIDDLSRDITAGPRAAKLMGELGATLRQLEGLDKDGPIPEKFQKVLKALRNSDNASLFDYIEAIGKLDLNTSRMKATDIAEAIKSHAASDPRLAELAREDNKPLLAVLSVFARKNAEQVDFVRVRRASAAGDYAAVSAQLKEIQATAPENLDALEKAFAQRLDANGAAARLRERYFTAKRQFSAKQRMIQRAEESRIPLTEMARRLEVAREELGKEVGAFSLWRPAHGVTYKAMYQTEAGEWRSRDRALAMVGPGVTENHTTLMEDMAWNRDYLEANPQLRGTRFYNEVEHQTTQIRMMDFERTRSIGQMTWLDKLTRDLGDRYASTGEVGGLNIHRMLNKLQGIIKGEMPHTQALSLKWSRAVREVTEAAGYKYYTDFLDDVNNHVQFHIESESGLGEQAALRHAVRVARELIPHNNTVGDNFAEKMVAFLRANKEASENLNAIAERSGSYVQDAHIKDPLADGQFLQRHSIAQGWSTTGRLLNANAVDTMVKGMRDWPKFSEFIDGRKDLSDAEYHTVIQQFFTPEVIAHFVDPFVAKPGRELFLAAGDAAHGSDMADQQLAQQVWDKSNGDVGQFIDGLFAETNTGKDATGLPAYRLAMLQRFSSLYDMMSKIAANNSATEPELLSEAGKGHTVMDGRSNDLIPPEFFRYQHFDPVNARIALAKLAFHGAFGRDASRLEAALGDVNNGIKAKADAYTQNNLGSLPKAEAKARAEAMGYDLKALERAANVQRHLKPWMGELVTYFGRGNSTGAVGDAKTFLELVNLNANLTLNQPSSALWNILSVLDFPLAHRGLGPTGLRASGSAAKIAVKDMLGGLLGKWGQNFTRQSEYHGEIGAVNDHREVTRLPFGTLLADIGKNGEFQNGTVSTKVTQGVRGLQTVLTKGIGSNSEATPFNAIWSPFRYLSNVVNSAVGTANVQAVEMMVKRGIEHFERNPSDLNNPHFRFSPKDLRMDGAWFSDEPAFKYYRDRLTDYNLGNMEDIVRGALGRARSGRLLTRDQALAIGMMASNEVTLESSINSRPIWMFNNPVWRLGGQLLGWPMTKMQQVADAAKNIDTGNYEAKSALKAMSTLALFTLPAGLAFSMAMDQYDEKVLKKRSNRRELSGAAVVPLLGPALAVSEGGANAAYAIMERLSRAGTFGLAGDALASLPAVTDPRSGFRDFDLNSRVLVFNQFANIRDAIRNLVSQDFSATYASVGRPLVQTLSGGAIQYTQIANSLLGLDNAEARVTDRINVNNWLRAAGRSAGVEMRASSAAHSAPTPVSVWVRQMELACLKNDRAGFLEAYRQAVDAARQDTSSTTPPAARVVASWKARNPLTNTFAVPLDRGQLSKLYANMDEDGRTAVRDSLMLYDRYTSFIEENTKAERSVEHATDLNAIRRKMANQLTQGLR